MNSIDMTGKVGIVTAAGGAIGRECARQFASAGAQVVVADLSVDRGTETRDRIRAAGGTAEFVRVDATVEADVADMVEFAVGAFGRLDFALNNLGGMYGMTGQPSIVETDAGEWAAVVALNLTSTFLCLKHEMRHMLSSGGSIVNTASAAAYRASRAPAAYTAAKHGLVGLTKRAAIEAAPHGLRVNAVAPGMVGTDYLVEALGEAEVKARGESMPIRRLLREEEVAAMAVWLCSDAASGITGAIIPIDGGLGAE